MSTLTPPPPQQTGAVRATSGPRRLPKLFMLLLGLVGLVILLALLYLLLHDSMSGDKTPTAATTQPAALGLPPSLTPAAASGGGAGLNGLASSAVAADANSGTANSGTAAQGTAPSQSSVVGWVGGAGMAPAHATGGLAQEGSAGTVLFDTGSGDLDADARQVIVAVAQQLKTQKPSSVQVTGYTDDVGTPDYNVSLSQRRASAVAAILNQQLPPGWVVTSGKGWSNPVAPNINDNNRQMNRRVTIKTT